MPLNTLNTLNTPITFRRITVAEVQAAVEKTGLELVAGLTCKRGCNDEVCGGCLILVVAVAEGFTMPTNGVGVFDAARHLGLDYEYASGLITGFDGRNLNIIGERESAARLGYDDGVMIRNATIVATAPA